MSLTLTDTEIQFVKDKLRIDQIKKIVSAKETIMWSDVEALKQSSYSDKWQRVTDRQDAFRLECADLIAEKEMLEKKDYQ